RRTAVIVGFIDVNQAQGEKTLHNAAAVLENGRLTAIRAKSLLPNYDVFDETRHFAPASTVKPVVVKGRRIGLTICEDMWNIPTLSPHLIYKRNPVAELARQGCAFFINISASPFHRGKNRLRLDLVTHHATRWK